MVSHNSIEMELSRIPQGLRTKTKNGHHQALETGGRARGFSLLICTMGSIVQPSVMGGMGRCFVRAQTRASYFINVSCYCCCSWETRGQHQALDHVLQAQELLEAPWAPYLSLRPAVLKLNAWG